MKDPPILTHTHNLPIKDKDKLLERTLGRLDRIRDARSTWEHTLARWYRRRFGMRYEKDFPWPGASNLHFPLIEKTIRRLKAALLRLIWGIQPVAGIRALDAELGVQIEELLDWLWRVRMDPIRALMMMADMALVFGRGILKATWNWRTRWVTERKHITDLHPQMTNERLQSLLKRQQVLLSMLGREFELDPREEDDRKAMQELLEQIRKGPKKGMLELRKQVVVNDEPLVTAVHPVDLFAASNTSGTERADFLAHRIRMPTQLLRERDKAGFYKNIGDVLAFSEKSSGTQINRDPLNLEQESREDITPARDVQDHIELFEMYLYHDWNGDKIGEPCVMTLHEPTRTIVRFIEYPYQHGEWPFIDFEAEVTDGRWYSCRGYSAMLEAMQVEINAQHNAKIDAMTITNAPIGFYARNSGFKPNELKWVPGQFIPLQNPSTDISFPVVPPHDISYEREEQSLKLWAEELAGTLDAAITAPSQTMERRTATEIDAVQAQSGLIFGLDAMYFQARMRKVYAQVLALWRQYGPDEVEVAVMGQDLPITVSREALMGQYDIIPSGTPANTTESARVGRLLQLLQVATQIQAPNVDYTAIIRMIAQYLDPNMARAVIIDQPGSRSQQQYEEQVDEIIRMRSLADAQWYEEVRPDDDHHAHAKAIQDFVTKMGRSFDREPARAAILRHFAEHQAQIPRNRTQETINATLPAAPMGATA